MQDFSFSKDLIAECQIIFRDEDGIFLTNEQADECLRGFAGLYLTFAGGREAPAASAAAPNPDLLYTSLNTKEKK